MDAPVAAVAAVVTAQVMDRSAAPSARPRPSEKEVLKFLEGRRSSFGLAMACCGASLQDRVATLSKSCTRINLPLGDSTTGSVLFESKYILSDKEMFVLAELISLGAFAAVKTMNLQNQQGHSTKDRYEEKINPGAYQLYAFGPAGFAALMEAARERPMPALALMNLGQNRIDDDGMAAFAATLSAGGFPALKQVKLYRNKFGDKGVLALSTALTGQGTLMLQDVYLGMHADELKLVTDSTKAALKAVCKVTDDVQGGIGAQTEANKIALGTGGVLTVHLVASGGKRMWHPPVG